MISLFHDGSGEDSPRCVVAWAFVFKSGATLLSFSSTHRSRPFPKIFCLPVFTLRIFSPVTAVSATSVDPEPALLRRWLLRAAG